jgi:outer membrane protein assembly factor BamB
MTGLLLVLALSPAPGDEAAPLGSAEFQASVARPFGWRGDGSGRFTGATPPTSWSATKNVRWSAVVGRSYSSPILAGKLVVVTAEPDLLLAIDRATGKEAWRVKVGPGDLADSKAREQAGAYKAKDAGMTTPTPITDGALVIAVFANGLIRAVDLSGKPAWTAFIDAEQSTGYGRSSSPIIVGGRLIVHMTNLYAFDLATGKELWVNTECRSNYGTPAGIRAGDLDLIVTSGGDVVRLDSGKGVNTQVGLSSNGSPVVHAGIVYFGDREVRAIRLKADFKDEEVWSSMTAAEVFGSPLLHEGTLFMASGKGDLFAFDAGKKGSADPLIDARALFEDEAAGGAGPPPPLAYSSPTLAGKFIFLNSLKGDTVVIEATREAKVLSRNRLSDGSGSSLIFSGRDLFLRDGEKLFCITQ